MSGECEKCREHVLKCRCHILLDPETIESDYNEAHQKWEHNFNKSFDNAQECFKETAFIPVKLFHTGIQTPNWAALAASLKKMQKEIKHGPLKE